MKENQNDLGVKEKNGIDAQWKEKSFINWAHGETSYASCTALKHQPVPHLIIAFKNENKYPITICIYYWENQGFSVCNNQIIDNAISLKSAKIILNYHHKPKKSKIFRITSFYA